MSNRVYVIGAGIIGLSCAYLLAEQGYDVLVFDQADAVGQGCSFANGAQLSYSYVAPLAAPDVPKQLPKWLLQSQSPLRFHWQWDPSLWRWGLSFLQHCTHKHSQATTQALLALAQRSRQTYERLWQTPVLANVPLYRSGKLVIHRKQSALHAATQQMKLQAQLGGAEQTLLNPQACVDLEPALATLYEQGQLLGGIYTPSEQACDSLMLCQALAQGLQQLGAQLHLGQAVSLQKNSQGQVYVQQANGQRWEVAPIVICAGAQSPALLRPLGIIAPIQPLKGYSLTIPVDDGAQCPSMSITDANQKVVYARLGHQLRIAGLAELIGHQTQIDPQRLAIVQQQAQALFPHAGDYNKAQAWAGLRPATPSGRPIVSATRYPNLYLNIGHGALGLTLAMGSASLVTALLRTTADPLLPLFQDNAI